MFFIWSFSTKTRNISDDLRDLSDDNLIQTKPVIYGVKKWRQFKLFFLLPLTPKLGKRLFIFNGEESIKYPGVFLDYIRKNGISLSEVWNKTKASTTAVPEFFFSSILHFWIKFLYGVACYVAGYFTIAYIVKPTQFGNGFNPVPYFLAFYGTSIATYGIAYLVYLFQLGKVKEFLNK